MIDVEDPDDNIVLKAFTKGIAQFEDKFHDYITRDKPPIKVHIFTR